MKPFLRAGLVTVAAAVLAACGGNGSVVPSGSAANGPVATGARGVVTVTNADRAAAYTVRNFSYHLFPTSNHWEHAPNAITPAKTKIIYPAQLQYFGGPLMKTAVEHNIYVNCKTHDQKCWGDPEGFLTDVSGSGFAKILTQYTKGAASGYTFGEGTPVSYTHYSRYFYDNDLFSILHAVAKSVGQTGLTNEYHIFLPKGIDNCFDGTSICYSPNKPSTWVFCAYHGFAKFSDLGTVIFSVEPYQNVPGCQPPGIPKGFSVLNNSTDSTLGHEMFESITDPEPTFKTLGWYNFAFGEIGDICEALATTTTISGTQYYIQPMYSNKYHACANGP